VATILLEIRTDAAGAIEGVDRVADRVRRAGSAISDARRAAVSFVAAFAGLQGIKALISVTEQYTALQTKIKLVTKSTEEFVRAEKDVYEISQRTYAGLAETVTLYTRLTSSLQAFGKTAGEVGLITETITKSLAVSGATAQESSSAILQLSQAFGAGRLGGEEFNAVSEAAPILMEHLAKAIGVTRGELKKYAADGRLTAQVVSKAIEEQSVEIAAAFEKIPLTTTKALTQMQNAGTVAFGKMFGDGNLALAEFIAFFVPGIEALPNTVELAMFQVVEFFVVAWESIKNGILTRLAAFDMAWTAISNGAEVSAETIALVYANMVDSIQKGFGELLVSLGESLTLSGSLLGPAVTNLGAAMAGTADRVAKLTAEIKVSDAARAQSIAGIQQTIDLINQETDAAISKQQAITADVLAIQQHEVATKAATIAKLKAAEAEEIAARGIQLTAAQLFAQTEGLKKNTAASKAAAAEKKRAFDIASEELELLRDLINAEVKATKAKDDARKALENIIPAIEKSYALDGLTIEQRRIAEAGIKAETFAREQLAKVIKGMPELSEKEQAAIRAEAKARGEALEAAQIQTEAAQEENKRAAEEYEREWNQVFDNIVDAALEGGDALANVVRDYLKNIVKQFAKKIFLDIITRYSSQGKKGGSTSSGGGGDEEPTAFENGLTFLAGASGVRDAYRSGDPLSGAMSGAAAGSIFGPVGAIIGGIVGALAGIFGGPKPPDLRLGAYGATRKPEQEFATAFGRQQIGVRGGTDTAQFISLLTDFDKQIAGVVGSFANGTQQLEAVQNRLRTWSVDLKGDAITTEAVLGSRFNAILSTFNADIQAFVGTLGTTQERAQRLQDAAFIEGAARGSILANTFSDLARVLTDNKIAGESVAQTYERLSASVEILRAALSISGVELTQTGDALIKFAADIATAAGGTQAAAALWNTYFETFYDAEERAGSALDQANARKKAALDALGLEDDITAAAFRAAFEAALPNLTPEQVVQWLRAGAAIGAATDAQTAYTAAVDEGAAATQAAADKIAAALLGLDAITAQIDDGFTVLARSGLTEFQNSLLNIDDGLRANIAALTAQRAAAAAAGASSEQLAGYDLQLGRAHLLAAAQAAAAIAQLTKAGRSLVAQLRLGGGGAAILAAQGVNAFQQIGEAANNVYEAMLAAQKSLREYLDSQLLGNLTALTPAEQFAEAQRQLAAAVAAGMNGDPEAIRRAQQLADVVLRLGRDRFASGQQFTDLEASIRAALSGLLGVSPGSPGGSVGGTAGAIGNLGDELGTQTDENRAQLMAQLTEIIRELVGATGLSLAEIATSLGLNMTAFVTSLGVNLENLTVASTGSLADIARSLGIELGELAQNVGVDLGQLANAQSLLNDAIEAEIKKLPEDQRLKLKPLLDAVEASADDPAGLAIAKQALVDEILKIGGSTAVLMEPFFDDIDPTDPLTNIDDRLRDGFRDTIAAIKAWNTAPPASGPAPAFANSASYATTSGGSPELRALGAIAGRLNSIENTIQRGDRANMAATYNTGNKQAAATDRSTRANNAGRLVMSE